MNQSTWNKLIEEYAPPFGAFLQSWEWGVFQESLGREVLRVHVPGLDSELVASAIRMPLPFGQSYWYVPKGPLGYGEPDNLVEKLRAELPDAMFIRCEPSNDLRLMQVPEVQPAHTTILDLTLGEEKLLAAMKPKTRYNIKVAAKHEVECRFVGIEMIDDFIRLMEQTSVRDRFAAHPAKYYKKMLESMQSGEAKVRLVMAFYEGRPIAGNIIVDFAGVRTYLHGATSNLHRNVMAQYGLHMFLIRDAIAAGMKSFDFWGVAPENAPSDHPWAGITRYKLSYGGETVAMPGTFDLPMRHLWYSLYGYAKSLRRRR